MILEKKLLNISVFMKGEVADLQNKNNAWQAIGLKAKSFLFNKIEAIGNGIIDDVGIVEDDRPPPRNSASLNRI